jgi:hypothetical protein
MALGKDGRAGCVNEVRLGSRGRCALPTHGPSVAQVRHEPRWTWAEANDALV